MLSEKWQEDESYQDLSSGGAWMHHSSYPSSCSWSGSKWYDCNHPQRHCLCGCNQCTLIQRGPIKMCPCSFSPTCLALLSMCWHQDKQMWLKIQVSSELCMNPTEDQEVILTDNPISWCHPVPGSVTWWARIAAGRWQEECLFTSLNPTGSPTVTTTASCQVIH